MKSLIRTFTVLALLVPAPALALTAGEILENMTPKEESRAFFDHSKSYPAAAK